MKEPSYLHVIRCVPMYSKLNDSKYETFDQLFKLKNEFGILTSKQLPPVSYYLFLLNYNMLDSLYINFDCIKYR